MRVGDLYPVWWDTGDGRPAGEHMAKIRDIRPYTGPVEGLTHILVLDCPRSHKGWTEMSVTIEPEDMHFRLGNCMRGHFEGWFPDASTAWKMLSQRFMLSFPTEQGGGHHVQMYVFGVNRFGHAEWMMCKDEVSFTGTDFSDEEVREKCKRTIFHG